MLRSIGREVLGIRGRRRKKLRREGFAEKEGFKPGMKEWGVIDDEWRVVGIDGKAVIFVCVGLCVCLCEKFPFVSRPMRVKITLCL